jgi:hypothetical protein
MMAMFGGMLGGNSTCPKCQKEPDENGDCPEGHGNVQALQQRAMDQMMSAMRGGMVPTLNPDATEDEAAFLDDDTLDKREQGVEMMVEVAKMRYRQATPEAFLEAMRTGKVPGADLETIVSAFDQREIEVGKIYCKHCNAAIWHDEDDSRPGNEVFRHEVGEMIECGPVALGMKAEPIDDSFGSVDDEDA